MLTSPPEGSSDDASSDGLVRKLLEGRLSPAEFETVQTLLRTDVAFRKRYLHLVDLEAALYEEFSSPASTKHRVIASSFQPRDRRRRQRLILATVVCAVGIVTLIGLYWQLGEPIASHPRDRVVFPAEQTAPEFVFTPARIEQTPDAAVLTHVHGVESAELRVGRRFKPGTLDVRQGQVQLEFLSGARVAVAGPAILQITSKDAATLITGQATAQVPPRARGFVLNTPDAAVVDLGTEFGVRVDETGGTHVEVLDGEVEVSQLGDDGNTLVSRLLDESQLLHVDELGMDLEVGSAGVLELPEIAPLDLSALPVGDDYVRTVRESAPILYWRFEVEESGQIRNEVGDRWWANIIRSQQLPESIQLANGHVHFDSSPDPRFVISSETLDTINRGTFSIELWVRPDHLDHMTCLSVVPEEDSGVNHLNVIEVATATQLVHEPGSIRFLHRYPPAQTVETGTNLFAGGTCTPGQWQHVVAIKGDGVLELYSNGRLARQIFLELPDDDEPYQLYLGQLRKTNGMRQFQGAIDEFAIYDRALTPAEVEQHFELVYEEGSPQ